MAQRAAKKAARKKAGRRRKPTMDFHAQMVLFRWALRQLGVEDLKSFKDLYQITPDSPGGLDPRTGLHRFHESLAGALPTAGGWNPISIEALQGYEQNLLEHTQSINTARAQHSKDAIEWKYHQYLALLFTEMFLDRYFADAVGLRAELNGVIADHDETVSDDTHPDWIAPFVTQPTSEDDADATRQLARLAFWCATGSGKTLLMHVHIRQFRHYHRNAYKAGKWPQLDQVILVTPNDGLSIQHAEELRWSGFDVASVGDAGVEGLFADQARQAVKILSIHKFREDQGKATVATSAFEGCNLVLVDEGHRGAGAGGEGAWLSRRNELADGGFTFEYSATFKEAVQGDDGMRMQYARSILFDYAYRSYYRDGYGKDFTILNLEDDEKQTLYLTAALLLYYQQMRVWMDGGEAIQPFRIDKPLWVFVGHTVTGGKAKSVADKASVSDVVEVLLFIQQFLSDQAKAVQGIRELLAHGLTDAQGRNLLDGRLRHFSGSGDQDALANELHEGILRDVFHAQGGGRLTVQLYREASGELALKVGEGEPFGVVNVGDPGAVADACESHGITRLEDDVNRESLFLTINRDDSTINLLVGSRKFTEGWNSWRVSSIGLMNMGKGEGTQIVQLFGRGVRLRGYRTSLRRSSVLKIPDIPKKPENLRQVETLQVFGVKAGYMETFRDWIFSEVPEAMERQVWELPVVETLPEKRLRTLALRDVIDGVKVERGAAFRKLGPLVRLRPPSETAREDDWLRGRPTRLNWLPKIKGIQGGENEITDQIAVVDALPTAKLTDIPSWCFDVDALLFGLEAFKASRGLDRLYVDRAAIRELLARDDWYVLHATPADMSLDRVENRSQWQRMAQQLLDNYAERFYRFVRGRWEAPYIDVVDVVKEGGGLRDEYSVDGYMIESSDLVTSAEEIRDIAEFVDDLKQAIDGDKLATWSQFSGKWRTVPFGGHLYQPLLYVGKKQQIRVSPVPLNRHEASFVEGLAKWCESNEQTEVHLLRNQSVTGLGFFQASNFFPDFLLWVEKDGLEHLAFVDPKGLHHFDRNDPKVQFASREIPRLQEIVSRQVADLRLHSFIISNTSFAALNWTSDDGSRVSRAELQDLNVLFESDGADTYIAQLMAGLQAWDCGS